MGEKTDLRVNCSYRILYTAVLSCACLFAGGGFLGIEHPFLPHVLTVLVTAAALTGLSFFKGKKRLLYVTALTAALLMAGAAAGASDCLEFARSYKNWLTGLGVWKEELTPVYGIMQAVWITALGYLLQILFEKYPLLQRGAACLIPAALLSVLFTGKTVSHMGVVLLIWYFAVVCMEWIQSRWKKVRDKNRRAHMLWVMPFMAVYLLAMALLPVPEKPYDWGFVKHIYAAVRDAVIRVGESFAPRDQEDFQMAMSGFSDKGKLLGGFAEDDELVMTVAGQTGIKSNVYLTGKIFDTFDGREWTQQNRKDDNDRLMDTLETIYAVRKYDSANLSNYVYGSRLTVRFEHFRTGYIFAPLKTWRVWSVSDREPYSRSGGNMLFGEQKGYGTQYGVHFYQMNVDHPEFYKFAEAPMPDDEDIWKKAIAQYMEQNQNIPFAELQAHRERIREYYLSDVELSPPIQEWLTAVTVNAKTDIEKLKCIENALSGFTYTRSPGELPGSISNEEEFLEYFLLESRRGYCSHFATAFTLLARAEGLPARYVQGFCIPMGASRQVSVYASMAHAWPEVYLEGIGWIPFEPAPGYDRIRYTPWEIKTANEEGGSEDRSAIHYWEINGDLQSGKAMQETEELNQPEGVSVSQLLQTAAMIVSAVIFAALLMLAADALAGKWRYRSMSPAERFRAEVYRNLRILALLGYEKRETETLSELGERAGEELSGKEKEILSFISHYEEVIYGGGSVTQGMTKQAAEQGKALLWRLKEMKKKAYPYYCFKLYISTQKERGERKERRRSGRIR